MSFDLVTFADWGGSVVAGFSIVALFQKSLWYWYFSIVATSLWFYVFVATDAEMVAGLQLSYIGFALYGIARWHIEERGGHVPARLEHAGTLIAAAIFAATAAIAEFSHWTSYVELAAVSLAILANWLTAMKIVWCWPVWISTNVLFAAVFFELELWGLFAMQFVYGALSLVGWRQWLRDRDAALPPVPARTTVLHA